MSAHPGSPYRRPRGGVESPYGRGAVDALDVAAELESSGFSERMTRQQLQGRDVFEVAEIVHGMRRMENVAQDARLPEVEGELRSAIMRALGLLAGLALIAATYAAAGVPESALAVVAVLAWVNGQNTAAIVWSRHGRGIGGQGLTVAVRWGLWSVALSAPVGLGVCSLLGHPPGATLAALLVVVQLYAVAVSVLSGTDDVRLGGPAIVLGAVVALALYGAEAWRGWIFLAFAGTVAVLGLLTARALRRDGVRARLSRSDLRAVWPAMLQAVALSAAVLVVLGTDRRIPAMPFVIGSVVLAAVADPLLVVCRHRLRAWAAELSSFAAMGVRAAITALGCVAVALAIGLGASVTLAGGPDAHLVVVAAGYGAAATISASLRTFGAPWLAVFAVLPTLTGVVVVALGAPGGPTGLVLIAAGVVLAAGSLARTMTDPRSYL